MDRLAVPGAGPGTGPPPRLASSEEGGEEEGGLGYQQTLMYGRYSRSLGESVKAEARRQQELERTRRKEYRKRAKAAAASHSTSLFPGLSDN